MANILRNVRVKFVSVVDRGANMDPKTGDGARIMLFKRDTTELSDNERRSRINAAAQDRWGDKKEPWKVNLQDVIGNDAIVYRDGKLYRVPFTIGDKGLVTFTNDGQEVVAAYDVLKRDVQKDAPNPAQVHVDRPDWLTKELADWTAKATLPSGLRGDLPDSAFAAVWTDSDGKKQRKLPYRHADGTVDLAHLRNALARLSQTDMPSTVRGEARRKLDAAAKEHNVGKNTKQSSFFKRLGEFFTKAADAEAGPLVDWAEQEEGEPEHKDGDADMMEMMKAHAEKLGKALEGYGDGAGLAADHPLHALKAMHKELCDKIAEANKSAEADATKDAEADADADAGRVQKGQTVTKREAEITKALADVRKQLADVTKREAVNAQKVVLAKFQGLTVDAEKDAEAFTALSTENPVVYKRMTTILSGASAMLAKAHQLEVELGTDAPGSGTGSAWAEIEAEAAKLVQKDGKLTQASAINKVMESRTDLVKRHLAETEK